MATLADTKSTQNQDTKDWRRLAQTRKQQQLDSIPLDWKITVPKDRQNVIHIPYECGLLTPLELEITDTIDVEALLLKLRSGTWSSVQVTTAFYKRALMAHQTVSASSFGLLQIIALFANFINPKDKLSN